MCLPCHVRYPYFVNFFNFGCHVQASQLFKHAQASSQCLITMMPKVDVVDLSSSDTEALLDSLFVSTTCDSPSSRPCARSDGDSFKDWPKANDMAASVYVALSADASISRMPTVNASVMAESLVLLTHLFESFGHS
jgi:hypothetical protein